MTGWTVVHDGYDPDRVGLRETLGALGNGYIVTRAAAPDAHDDGVHYPGTYLAGGYDRRRSEVAGRRVENEDLVNLPNWLVLQVGFDNGPWLGPDQVDIHAWRQELDLRAGLLCRDVTWSAGGRRLRWREKRLVSMADPHLAGLQVTLTLEAGAGPIHLRTALDGGVTNNGVARYRDLDGTHLETLEESAKGEALFLRSRMIQSRREIALAARTRVWRGADRLDAWTPVPDCAQATLVADLAPGQSLTVEKMVAIHAGTDRAISEAGQASRDHVRAQPGFDMAAADHRDAWAELWDDFDIRIACADPDAQLRLRAHIFHLLQTVSRHSIDLDVGVPPRGWHGEAYRGHIMWDELFIFPFLTLRQPVLTRALLRYRHRRLEAARRAAAAVGCRGALFPWQSGSDGREEAQSLHLNPMSGRWVSDNSHRQRHINAAIVYNVWAYYQATGDDAFLRDYGAEMVLEIARMFAAMAEHDPDSDRYHIRGVMGPDEFHTAYPDRDPDTEGGLDNNAYTNVMAAWVLQRARDILDMLPPHVGGQLCRRLDLGTQELDRWAHVTRRLRVPFRGDIIEQFDGHGALKPFDWEGYRQRYGNIERLDRILEREGDHPNRYQVSKQADVLMLFFLFSADALHQMFETLGYPFDCGQIPANVHHYLGQTSHGSSLSRVVDAWVLARTDRARSWSLFSEALATDFADIQGGTTPEGIHLAAMAGTVDLVQRCYTGLEMRDGVLHFDPLLPEALHRLQTQVRYRGQVLEVTVDDQTLHIASRRRTSPPITVAYRGHARTVMPGDSYSFPLLTPAMRNRNENS